MNPPNLPPLFTGTRVCRLSSNRRLNLPPFYDLALAPVWFLVPGGITKSTRTLGLYPEARAFMRKVIKDVTGADASSPSLAEAISALKVLSLKQGMDPELVSAWVPAPRTNHLILNVSQIKWLNAKNRRLKLNGVLSHIQIRSVESWKSLIGSAKEERRLIIR